MFLSCYYYCCSLKRKAKAEKIKEETKQNRNPNNETVSKSNNVKNEIKYFISNVFLCFSFSFYFFKNVSFFIRYYCEDKKINAK